MKDKFFLDTNIFVYSFDQSSPTKKKTATELINSALSTGKGVISYQVVQEFLNVSVRKFSVPFSSDVAKEYYRLVLEPLTYVNPNSELFHLALDVFDKWKYSFYDSMIIAAAISSNSKILYSEDLQNTQKIMGLQIINPFQ